MRNSCFTETMLVVYTEIHFGVLNLLEWFETFMLSKNTYSKVSIIDPNCFFPLHKIGSVWQ